MLENPFKIIRQTDGCAKKVWKMYYYHNIVSYYNLYIMLFCLIKKNELSLKMSAVGRRNERFPLRTICQTNTKMIF